MVTGGIVDYDPVNKLYSFPPEHAAWLTRAATPDNIAVTTQWFSVLASVEDKILDCFKNGGGLGNVGIRLVLRASKSRSYRTILLIIIILFRNNNYFALL